MEADDLDNDIQAFRDVDSFVNVRVDDVVHVASRTVTHIVIFAKAGNE